MPYAIIDTYPSFREYWERVKARSIDEQIKAWETDYMSRYPQLFKLQVEGYEDMGVDWRKIAREKVFPKLPSLLPFIEEAWRNLREVVPRAFSKFNGFWEREFNVVFVLYVGIGCGAGWATEYCERYAVLLGLENIAELGWHKARELEGLVLHELSHIAHMALRRVSPKEFEALEASPFFLLYSEGFATRCEHLILGREDWRIASDSSWLEWCRENIVFLASEYLRRVERGEPINDFYGSWLNIKGRSQTGYYLGHEFIKSLEEDMDLEEIATMSVKEVESRVKAFLEQRVTGKAN